MLNHGRQMTACGCPVNAPEANPEQWDCPCGDHCPHCNKGNTVDQPTDLEYAAKRYGLNRPEGARILNAPKWAREYVYALESVITRACVAVRLDAGNDGNGNPGPLANAITMSTTASEYRSTVKEYGPGSIARLGAFKALGVRQ